MPATPLPPPYTRQTSFTDWEANHPGEPATGTSLDAEFNAVQVSLTDTQARLAQIQRDDGSLANYSVGRDQLDPELAGALIGGFYPRGAWHASTGYKVSDAVNQDGILWAAVVDHVSSASFAVDVSDGKWMFVSQFAAAPAIPITPIPPMTATTVQGALETLSAFDVNLGNATDPVKGVGMLGWVRSAIALLVNSTLSRKLAATQLDIWEVAPLVTYRPVPSDYSTWDWTPAIEAARVSLSALGGGVLTFGQGGVYQATSIRLDRFVVLDGRGAHVTELKQMAGVNLDFIKSENFDVLTGTGLTVADSRVPSWMGLKDIRVNGNRYNATTNPDGNTSGFPVKMYGPSQLLQGTVLIYGGASGGLYTEDSTSASSSSWRAQEEGKFGNVICRENGGFAGWHCRGPHNNDANSIISGFNDGWGFYMEEDALWGGSFDRIGVLHTYANGRSATPALDTGSYIGGIARIDTLVCDGDNTILQAPDTQVGKLRAYNIGGQQDGVVINGANCGVQHLDGLVWSSSVGRTALIINGDNCLVNGVLSSNNPDNEGMVVNGSGCTTNVNVKNFSTAGRIGLKLNGLDNDVRGNIRNCGVGFNYLSGTENRINLSIFNSGAQVPVTGLAPQSTDRVDIRSRGSVIGGCKTNIQTAQVAMDTAAYTVVTTAHGLLYTPPVRAVRVNWLASSPDSSVWDEALLRVVSADATNVVVGYKLATAAPAGTLARIGITIDLT